MPKQLTKTADLGQNWFANLYDDGSLTIRSPERGQRIELTKEEGERLRQLLDQVS